ncbi:hypothetical protein Tco_0300547 [Tanacetum coccineum]
MELDSLEDDQPFMVLSDEEEEVHAEPHAEIEDTSAPTLPSPKSIKIQELSTQFCLLQSQNNKLEKEKATAEAKAALLSAQPSFPNVQQLIELLVNSLKPKISKLLTDHDFSSSIPTELKELPSKIIDINEAVGEIKKYVEELEVEIPGDLKELPRKLKLSKLKVLDVLPILLNKVTEALDMFASVIESSSQKAGDIKVPSIGQAGTHPGEQVKDKGKKAISHEEMVEKESKSNSDAEVRPSGSFIETSKQKPLKKFTSVNEKGKIHQMTKEEIENQKGIKQTVKGDAAKSEINKVKQDLIDLMGVNP